MLPVEQFGGHAQAWLGINAGQLPVLATDMGTSRWLRCQRPRCNPGLGEQRGIVNIAAPNGADFSHNQFRDYNLGTEGLILNNGIPRTQSTQRPRSILGNPNRGGRAANAIVSEVNGGNPS